MKIYKYRLRNDELIEYEIEVLKIMDNKRMYFKSVIDRISNHSIAVLRFVRHDFSVCYFPHRLNENQKNKIKKVFYKH